MGAKLEGELDSRKMSETSRKLIDRHESLRTSFKVIDEQPVQEIHDDVEFEFEYYDVTDSQPAASLIEDFIRPFDLSQAPLLRAGLMNAAKGHIFIIDMHHIITDGTSMDLSVIEFMDLLCRRGTASFKAPVQRLRQVAE